MKALLLIIKRTTSMPRRKSPAADPTHGIVCVAHTLVFIVFLCILKVLLNKVTALFSI